MLTTSDVFTKDQRSTLVYAKDGKTTVNGMRFWTYENFVNPDLRADAKSGEFIAWSAIGGKSSTVAIANIGSRDAEVQFVNGILVVRSIRPAIDGKRSVSLPTPLDPSLDGNGIDAYLWTVTDVSVTEAEQLARRRRTHYTTVASDIYSSDYWRKVTKHQPTGSGARPDTVSEVLEVAAEVVARSKLVPSLTCRSRGHFP